MVEVGVTLGEGESLGVSEGVGEKEIERVGEWEGVDVWEKVGRGGVGVGVGLSTALTLCVGVGECVEVSTEEVEGVRVPPPMAGGGVILPHTVSVAGIALGD